VVKSVRGYDGVIKIMIIGLDSIYRVKQGGYSRLYPNITRLLIVFLPYNSGARHERIPRKILIDTIPHTLTGSDRDNAFTINRTSTKVV
jgi:hypothetical protein